LLISTLKAHDDGVLHLGLLSFRILSIF
jgi:hypothetical protein